MRKICWNKIFQFILIVFLQCSLFGGRSALFLSKVRRCFSQFVPLQSVAAVLFVIVLSFFFNALRSSCTWFDSATTITEKKKFDEKLAESKIHKTSVFLRQFALVVSLPLVVYSRYDVIQQVNRRRQQKKCDCEAKISGYVTAVRSNRQQQ